MYLGTGATGIQVDSWRARIVGRRGSWRTVGWNLRIDLRRQLAAEGSRPPWQLAGGSSSSVYRVYYCFCEADGAVLIEEFVLSTAFVRLMEQ